MAARTNRLKHDPTTIERIRSTIETGQLIKRLTTHIKGECEMTNTQVQAANILLRKSLPDLAAVNLTGSEGGPIQFNVTWERD